MLESLGAAKIGIFGLGSVALFGGIMLLLKKFIQKDPQQKSIEVAKHEGKQEQLQDQIEDITKEQKILNMQFKMSKNASKESKEKVRKISKKAAIAINNVLKSEKIMHTDKVVDEEWKNL